MIALFLRDLTLALRAGSGLGLTLAFFLMIVMFISFSIGEDKIILARIAAGILWVGAILSCLLSLERIFQLDYEDGTLEALMTSSILLEHIVIAKIASHWVTTGLPLALLAPILGAMLNLAPSAMPLLVFSLIAGTITFSTLGTFAAALTLGVKRGSLLVSLLVMPLYIPTLIFGASVSQISTIEQNSTSALLIVYALMLIALAIVPFATAMALRATLR